MDNSSDVLYSKASGFFQGFLPFFYLVPPSHTYFRNVEEVPKYVKEAVPYFFILLFVEIVIRWFQGMPKFRVNDAIGSLSAGIIQQLAQAVMIKSFKIYVYIWIYKNYRIIDLPWDFPITWWVCFVVYDFLYYWFHRAAHEINLFWAAHQVHHSSEDYNLSTALRQSALQRFTSWFFYMPLALAIPPTQFIVHDQFNLLYQFWIHTECVNKLGPLEYIMNTASHHRVHHGRNRYCIDKNYAAVFIIWDRMFGTFQAEGDKIYYGLVHPIGTFEPLQIQIHHLVYIIKSVWNAKGLTTKLNILFKGPGWTPGSQRRLGDPTSVPEVPENIIPYDNNVPGWVDLYSIIHFGLVIAMAHILSKRANDIPYLMSLCLVIYITLCLTSIGLIYDQHPWSAVLEVTRLIVALSVDYVLTPHIFTTNIPDSIVNGIRIILLFSLLIWTTSCIQQMKFMKNEEKQN